MFAVVGYVFVLSLPGIIGIFFYRRRYGNFNFGSIGLNLMLVSGALLFVFGITFMQVLFPQAPQRFCSYNQATKACVYH